MLRSIVRWAKAAGVDTRALYQRLSLASIESAVREQGLAPLRNRLREIEPDLLRQYTYDIDAGEYARYWEAKMRGLHAFQVQCALDALDRIGGEGLTVSDIGDSSGTHGRYLQALAPAGRISRFVSVNLDPVAVDKVRARGGEAILAPAEELDLEDIHTDLFISFETVEHLTDPLRFLHRLAERGSADHFLMSVPYRRHSRFGGSVLHGPDSRMPERMTPEEVHILELSPGDWQVLARFAGYRTAFSRIYRQYPRYRPLRITQPLWRRLDFEGFLVLLLERDLSVARRYTGW